jgi:replicative DNA helicase
MSELIGQVEPQDLEAEHAVLGCLLLLPEAIPIVQTLVSGPDFYGAGNEQIFDSIGRVYHSGVGADTLTVRSDLERVGDLEKIGGPERLMELTETVPSSANAVHYARIVRRKALERAVKSTATRVLAACDKGDMLVDAELHLNTLRTAIDRVHLSTTDEPGPGTDGAVRSFEKAHIEQERLFTGFRDLDWCLGGLKPGHFILVAGRPSSGKTTFLVDLLAQVCGAGFPALVFSIETNAQDFRRRLLIHATQQPRLCLEGANPSLDAWSVMNTVKENVRDWPLFIDHHPRTNLEHVSALSRRYAAERGVRLLVIDYLQLMEPPRKREGEQEVAALSRELKCIAASVNLPLVVACQLNRDPENRDDHRPRMSDLRGSGGLEQDCDEALLLWRPDNYSKTNEHPGQVEINVAKHRDGETGATWLQFDGSRYTMRDFKCQRVVVEKERSDTDA